MQPYLFPYIGYFQLINLVDTFVIYDDVQFIKGGWINRNYIQSKAGKTLITLNLSGASVNKNINQISVGSNQAKLLKTIEQTYSSAKEFKQAFPLVKGILEYPEQNLAQFVGNSIIKICDFLKISTSIVFSSSLKKPIESNAEDKVINIVKQLQGDEYINSFGGMHLYSAEHFLDHNIILRFIKPKLSSIASCSPNEASLSIIHLLMHANTDKIRSDLNKYEIL